MHALEQTLLICAFRGLPFAAYAALSARFALWTKLLALAAYALVAGSLVALQGPGKLTSIALGLLYYVVVATTLPRCARALQEGRVTGGALFVMFTVVFFAVPNLALTSAAAGPFIVLGWDLLMCSHSYCHDIVRRREAPELKSCLFFLFVDPTLTWGGRAKDMGAQAQPLRSGRRAALGVLVIFGANALIRPAIDALPDLDLAMPQLATLTLLGALWFVAEYAAHSGLASLQIGLIGSCGYRVPERYNHPWLAKDPTDFWKRWNTYVGTWIWQYIFAPITQPIWSRETKARLRGLRRVLLFSGAVMATFAASGLLHDGYNYFANRKLDVFATELFLSAGVAILVWSVAGKLANALARAQERRLPQLGAFTRRATDVISRACLIASVITAAVVWG